MFLLLFDFLIWFCLEGSKEALLDMERFEVPQNMANISFIQQRGCSEPLVSQRLYIGLDIHIDSDALQTRSPWMIPI